jgi:hypothetical protein
MYKCKALKVVLDNLSFSGSLVISLNYVLVVHGDMIAHKAFKMKSKTYWFFAVVKKCKI